MAASVDIPTRIRVDAGVPAERPDLVAEALAAAAARALAHSHEVLGGAVTALYEAPTYEWTGSGAVTVDAPARADIERRATDALAAALPPAGPATVVDWFVVADLRAAAASQDGGAIARTTDSGYVLLGLGDDQVRVVRDLWRYRLAAGDDGRPALVREPASLDPNAMFSFRWIGDRDDAGAVRAALEANARDAAAAAVRAARDLLPAGVDESALIERLARAAAEADISAWEADPVAIGMLRAGGVVFVIRFAKGTTAEPGAEIELAAWTEVRALEPPAPPPGPPAQAPGLVEVPEGFESQGPTSAFPDGATPLPMCEPFEGEPRLDQLGADGERLHALMVPIARRLELVPCEYAGGFALMAATVALGRAAAVGKFALTADRGFLKPPPAGGTGNLGGADFEPAPSKAIENMQWIAAVAPEVRALSDAIEEVYRAPEHAALLPRGFTSWQLRFVLALNRAMHRAVAELFATTCRILLLQLLAASREQILARKSPRYAELFEAYILPRLRSIVELEQLRERLQNATRASTPDLFIQSRAAHTRHFLRPLGETPTISDHELAKEAWHASRDALAEVLEPPAEPRAEDPRARQILYDHDGAPIAIRDSAGRPWTAEGLTRAILLRRGLVEDIDPLVKQLDALPGALARFKDDGIPAELERLLTEMADENAKQSRLVNADRRYAVNASSIGPQVPRQTLADSGYQLGGIHLQAHLALSDAFRADPYYGGGVRYLFHVQLGIRAMRDFVELTGSVLLSVVCPPVGIAFGIATAVRDVVEAHERASLYRALIDPELVLSRAEVETGLFVAYLGLAFSLVPVAPGAVKVGNSIVRVGVKRGVSAAGRALPRYGKVIVQSAVKEAMENLRDGIIAALVKELVQDQVMDAVAGRLLEPLVKGIEDDIDGRPVGGMSGATALLERLRAQAEKEGR